MARLVRFRQRLAGQYGCHVMDGAFWSLKIEHPGQHRTRRGDGRDRRALPHGNAHPLGLSGPRRHAAGEGLLVRRLPGRNAGRAACRSSASASTARRRNRRGGNCVHYLPPLLLELQAKYPDEKFESNGTLYVGEKGILYTGCYGGDMHIVPKARMERNHVAAQDAAAAQAFVRRFPQRRSRRPHRHRRQFRIWRPAHGIHHPGQPGPARGQGKQGRVERPGDEGHEPAGTQSLRNSRVSPGLEGRLDKTGKLQGK